jgi:hypothetical protein
VDLVLGTLKMPKLPLQRGFYDDVRPFQRRDVRVRTEAFAPSPRRQRVTQLAIGALMMLFLLGTLALRLAASREEAHKTYRAADPWQGVAASRPPPAAAAAPITPPHH